MVSKRPGAIPRPWARGPRPHRWRTGTDPELHRKFTAWRQQRNQALHRREEWDLTLEVWIRIWGDFWRERGRTRGSRCMSRIDWEQGWTETNVAIVTREEHARAQGLHRARVAGRFA